MQKDITINPETVKPLKGKHIIQLISTRPPTERRILWIVYHRKQAFNARYTSQFVSKSGHLIEPNSYFNQACAMLDSLNLDGYIKQDEDWNWHVTIKGQLYRFIKHPLLPIIATASLIVGILAALISYIIKFFQ